MALLFKHHRGRSDTSGVSSMTLHSTQSDGAQRPPRHRSLARGILKSQYDALADRPSLAIKSPPRMSFSNYNQAWVQRAEKQRPELENLPYPKILRQTEVLVRVEAAVIPSGKFLAQYRRSCVGKKPPLVPRILGAEGSGYIMEIGPQQEHSNTVSENRERCKDKNKNEILVNNLVKVGSRVAFYFPTKYAERDPSLTDGSMQRYVVVDVDNVIKIPDTVGYTEAAVLPLVFTLAASVFFISWGVPMPVRAESTEAERTENAKWAVIVIAREMQVCSAFMQVADDLGFTVYAVAPYSELPKLRTWGVYKTFNYDSTTIASEVIDYVIRDRPVGGVFDCIGDARSKEAGMHIIDSSESLHPILGLSSMPRQYTSIETIVSREELKTPVVLNKNRFITRDYLPTKFREMTFSQRPLHRKTEDHPANVRRMLGRVLQLETIDERCVVSMHSAQPVTKPVSQASSSK